MEVVKFIVYFEKNAKSRNGNMDNSSAPLKEEICMKPPRGVLKLGQEGKVLKLLKGLYGLKQAGRGWYMEMSKVPINEIGFKHSAIDHSVFYQRSREEHTIFAVATDNMAVTSK